MGTFLTLQILATLFPLTAGLLLYGWRAAGTTAVVVGCCDEQWQFCGKLVGMGGRCGFGIALAGDDCFADVAGEIFLRLCR